jgi:hypothetical protein
MSGTKNIYDFTIETIKLFEENNRHDLIEWIETINPILKAAGKSYLDFDYEITHLSISREFESLHVSYTFVARGCDCDGDVILPIRILKENDPIKAANIFNLERILSRNKYELKRLNEMMKEVEKNIANAEKELRRLK